MSTFTINKFDNNSKQKKETKKRSEISPNGRMSTRINKLVGDLFKANDSDTSVNPKQRLEDKKLINIKKRLRNK